MRETLTKMQKRVVQANSDAARLIGLCHFNESGSGRSWKDIERPPELPRKSGVYIHTAGREALSHKEPT